LGAAPQGRPSQVHLGLAAWLLDHNDAGGQPAAAVAAALDRTASATGELARDELLDNITSTGRHFAAWNNRELFAQEVRAAFRSLR
jgi:hypothetical protein